MIKKKNSPNLILGCGLIRIGRAWGVDNKPVPSESEVQTFLEGAFELGIRFFDTAPAYGLSQSRLGVFLKNLSNEQRKEILVATKFGEHWDSQKNEPYVDHSYQALQTSLEHSLAVLGSIDVLQLHRTTSGLLDSNEIQKAFALALELGVAFLGASVSDEETGLKACLDERFAYIQLPFNEERTELLSAIEQAKSHQKQVLFNRPFAMGAVAQQTNKNEANLKMIEAYKKIVELDCPGVILTGTASLEHLKQNINNFETALYE